VGKRGPAPTPTATAKKRGTYRPDRRKAEPQPTGEAKKPAWVKGAAAKHWKALAPWLAELDLLTALDTVALGLLCDAMADYLEAGAVINEKAADGNKFVSVTDKGNEIQNPLVGVRNKAWDRVVKLLREFGMTPSARAGLAISNAKDGEQDPLLKLMKDRMN